VTTVALDGRGAERGADAIVAGARAAAADGVDLRVYGDPRELAAVAAIDGAELVPAPGEITNDDDPVAAVRSRSDASVVIACRDVAEGRAQAIVSAVMPE
jgi:glycerol-3-phosphate acyltransferase PlsX